MQSVATSADEGVRRPRSVHVHAHKMKSTEKRTNMRRSAGHSETDLTIALTVARSSSEMVMIHTGPTSDVTRGARCGGVASSGSASGGLLADDMWK